VFLGNVAVYPKSEAPEIGLFFALTKNAAVVKIPDTRLPGAPSLFAEFADRVGVKKWSVAG
jgi:hypothetical protein